MKYQKTTMIKAKAKKQPKKIKAILKKGRKKLFQ